MSIFPHLALWRQNQHFFHHRVKFLTFLDLVNSTDRFRLLLCSLFTIFSPIGEHVYMSKH